MSTEGKLRAYKQGPDEIINNTGGTKCTNQNSDKHRTDRRQQSTFLIILTTFLDDFLPCLLLELLLPCLLLFNSDGDMKH